MHLQLKYILVEYNYIWPDYYYIRLDCNDIQVDLIFLFIYVYIDYDGLIFTKEW